MSAPQVIVYSRPGCHLCDDACALLERYGLTPTTVSIDESPELVSRYGDSIPVVTFDGEERFRGRIDEVLLQRLLIAAQRSS